MTTDRPEFVDVAFPGSLEVPLTYRVPDALRLAAAPGKRVLVPLGSRMATGYVVGTRERPPVPDLKDVSEFLDTEPLLDSHLLGLTRWVADYYLCPWGEVIRTALPPGMDTFTRRMVGLTAAGQTALEGRALFRPEEADLLAALSAKPVTLLGLARRWPKAERLARGLAQRGLVALTAEIRPPRVRPLQIPFCSLAAGVDPERVELPLRATKQRAILRALAAAPQGLPRGEAAAGASAALAALVKRSLVVVCQVEITRDPFAGVEVPRDTPWSLSPTQAEALQAVCSASELRQFRVMLLHGVTGSGKTEVYLQAIASVLAAGGQALVLVPEIALTPLTVQRFLARFGSRVAVLHSGLSGGERFDAWRRIRSGGADIVVGARSAVYAPLPRLGILVVDEEHDPSYKQEEMPRYHGRDVAVMRAKMLGIPIILGSATPSFESVERVAAGRYHLLRLPDRIEARALPQVEVVDLRQIAGGERLLSPRLCAAIAERLQRGEQSLLFLNRRGFSTLLLCQECGAAMGCPHCSISLTYHAASRRMWCHTCGFTRRPPERCPECQGARLTYLGFGTQQVEAAVRGRFPAARVDRMDRDTTRSWRAAEEILRRLVQGEIDILVGTQMIGKGHDVPNVTLVGVLSADMALNLPDFRAGERAFALFTQVAGRSGRGERPGLALIQSFNPEHYILKAVQTQDYQALWEAESLLRRDQELPPFSRLVLAILSSPEEKAVEAAAAELARLARQAGVAAGSLSGPAPAPLYKLRSRFRWHLLVRGRDVHQLHGRVQEAARLFQRSTAARGVRLDLDVDPVSLC